MMILRICNLVLVFMKKSRWKKKKLMIKLILFEKLNKHIRSIHQWDG